MRAPLPPFTPCYSGKLPLNPEVSFRAWGGAPSFLRAAKAAKRKIDGAGQEGKTWRSASAPRALLQPVGRRWAAAAAA